MPTEIDRIDSSSHPLLTTASKHFPRKNVSQGFGLLETTRLLLSEPCTFLVIYGGPFIRTRSDLVTSDIQMRPAGVFIET